MRVARTNKIRFWCELALSILSVGVAIGFLVSVALIYYGHDGGDMYSRDIVWNKLKYLIAPMAVWVAAIIGCFVLSVLFPDNKLPKAPVSAADKVKRLRRRMPAKGEGDSAVAAARIPYARAELWRYIAYGVASAFALGVAIYTIVYLADHSHFTSGEINADVLALVKNVLPFIAASFVLFVGATVYEWAVAKRELSGMTKLLMLCKGMPIAGSPLARKLDAAAAAVSDKADIITWAVRGVVFVTAIVFISLGIWNGGARDVLYKAINICTECIGLG